MSTSNFSIFDRFEKDQVGILLSILILQIIKREKRIWGYDIKQILTKITENKIEIKNSTVYTILKSFESKYALLESEMEERRRYYKLTEKGIKNLSLILNDWKKMTEITIHTLRILGVTFDDDFKEVLLWNP